MPQILKTVYGCPAYKQNLAKATTIVKSTVSNVIVPEAKTKLVHLKKALGR